MNKEACRFTDPSILPEYSAADYIDSGEFDFGNPESPHYVEPGDSPAMLKKVVEFHFRDRSEDLDTAHERLAILRARDRSLILDNPRATIVIATIENTDVLRDSITQLAKQDGIKQTEIILYGNMPTTFTDEQKQEKQAALDTVTDEFPQLCIRSINQEYDWNTPDDKPLMGKLRSDYQDLIALDAAERGFGIDHPIITLDADTKSMTQGSIMALTDAIIRPESTMSIAHLETRYLFDEQNGSMSDVRKLAVLQEIRRRQWLRTRTNNDTKHYGSSELRMPYDEEWGAALALGPYLIAGGYNSRGVINENRDLKSRMIHARDEITAVMQHAKPSITGVMDYRARYLPQKVVRCSARRQEDFLKSWMQEPTGTDSERAYKARTEYYITEGLPYEAFSHTDKVREKVVEAVGFRDEEQARRMIGAILFKSTIPAIRGDLPLPDPKPILKRLQLPYE